MSATADLEAVILANLRQLSRDRQAEVLNFVEFLRQQQTRQSPEPLSLVDLARLPVAQRHQHLAPAIAATTADFQTDPELTEFAILDSGRETKS